MTFGSDVILSDDLIFFNSLETAQGRRHGQRPGHHPWVDDRENRIHWERRHQDHAFGARIRQRRQSPRGSQTSSFRRPRPRAGRSSSMRLRWQPLSTALSSLHPTNFAAGVGAASGGNGIAGSFSVNVINQTTHAYISSGADDQHTGRHDRFSNG